MQFMLADSSHERSWCPSLMMGTNCAVSGLQLVMSVITVWFRSVVVKTLVSHLTMSLINSFQPCMAYHVYVVQRSSSQS